MSLFLSLRRSTSTSASIQSDLATLVFQQDAQLCRRRRSFTTEICSVNQGPGEKRRRGGGGGEQGCVSGGSAVPLPGLFHHTRHRNFNHSRCQIPFLLPHPSSLFTLQAKLLTPPTTNTHFTISLLPPNAIGNLELSSRITRRGFSTATSDSDEVDEVTCENERESESVNVNTSSSSSSESVNVNTSSSSSSSAAAADPQEVDRVCKVIDELFALDRNMEAVLDECGIHLSHHLVVAVLKRFQHARKPAFRFFCWAGHKPGFAHDSITYNSMMSILGKTRQFETMVSLLEEMGPKQLLTMETFVIAFKAFAAAKERKKAVGIFELMKHYNFQVGVDTINCLLDTLGRAKLGKEMQLLFDKLKGRFTLNLQTYTILLNGWCTAKNLMEAGRVWNEMIDKGFKPDIVAYNTMLGGLLRGHKRSDAVKLFEVMKAKGPSPNTRSYSILIQDFCKQNKMKEAVDSFYEMRESGCQPDAVVYTCLITGFGNQKNMEAVCDLLREMKEDGCTPDGQTYNALIKVMTRQQRMPDDAVKVYKKMIQNGIEPSIHTYNMIMKSFFQTRNYDMGRAVWDEMIRKGFCPDDNSYTVLIAGLVSQGRSGEACKYLEEMIEKGMKPPQLDFNKFTADFSRAGKPDILEELAQKMKFAGKFEVSHVFARWAEMTKKRVKRRDPIENGGQ